MNFDISEDAKAVATTAQDFLREHSPLTAIRRVFDGHIEYDSELWRSMAEMGWLGADIPEAYGGFDLGSEVLCVLAEEIGRALAPVPFSTSVSLATNALCTFGNVRQKNDLLPKLASGDIIGAFALAEGVGDPHQSRIKARVQNDRLYGEKYPVANGGIADFVIIAARNADDEICLYLSDIKANGVEVRPLDSIDPSRNDVFLTFENVEVEPLDLKGSSWSAIQNLLDQAAVICAFEQLGGARACLEMARDYALDRYAFGRPIGSFQAIKHKLADVYIATELAQSNAYYGAWALAENSGELPRAAATAHLSAQQAYQLAARENIQTHGGMGITWEADCHMYFKRARSLGLEIGGPFYWKNRLMTELENQAGSEAA